MLHIQVINCDNIKVDYNYTNEMEFVKTINSDNENIPMLDDILTKVNTDNSVIQAWWRNTSDITVDSLYNQCV